MNIDSSQGRAYANDYGVERSLVNRDPIEEEGREFWYVNRLMMEKWDHKFHDWAFYPRRHGTRKDVEKHGEQGIHYAAGYHQLGQMVQKYGNIIQKWPDLPTNATQEDEVEVTSVHTEDVQPNQLPTVTSIQRPKNALYKIKEIETNLSIPYEDGAERLSIKERICKAEQDYFGTTQEGALKSRIDNIAKELGIFF